MLGHVIYMVGQKRKERVTSSRLETSEKLMELVACLRCSWGKMDLWRIDHTNEHGYGMW